MISLHMNEVYKKAILNVIEKMKIQGVVFESGLTDEEVGKIESIFNITFPPDLRFFYQTALPISISSKEGVYLFPAWRKSIHDTKEARTISEFGTWVFEGICFDIEKNNFWMKDWGEKPSTYEEQVNIARQHHKAAPTLIPLYQHRCTPSSVEEGNPVFSIWQTDIIYYGLDLVSYFNNEFKLDIAYDAPVQPKKVPFWDSMIQMNNEK